MVALIVDDEPILRMTAADMVEEAGFTAVEAVSADAGYASWKRATRSGAAD